MTMQQSFGIEFPPIYLQVNHFWERIKSKIYLAHVLPEIIKGLRLITYTAAHQQLSLNCEVNDLNVPIYTTKTIYKYICVHTYLYAFSIYLYFEYAPQVM